MDGAHPDLHRGDRRQRPMCIRDSDPGVGSDRGAVAIHVSRGDYLVGPDNGLLLPAIEALGGVEDAWLLDARTVRTQGRLTPVEPSHTFHGRDVFAPAAALLATGLPPAVLG